MIDKCGMQGSEPMMSEVLHDRLEGLIDDLVRLTLLAETAMGRATTALVEADAQLAARAVADTAAVAALCDAIDEHALDLAARDHVESAHLRALVAALRMTVDLGRMGVLARHVAQIAARQAPHHTVPGDLRKTVERMARIAEETTATTRRAVSSRDWHVAADVARSSIEMQSLAKDLYEQLVSDPRPHAFETAMDVTLLGRYYERYTDHAVAVARRVPVLAGSTGP
jgi:phosphate transport system protein